MNFDMRIIHSNFIEGVQSSYECFHNDFLFMLTFLYWLVTFVCSLSSFFIVILSFSIGFISFISYNYNIYFIRSFINVQEGIFNYFLIFKIYIVWLIIF